jgi:ribosomal protein L37AE/L43A
MDGREQCPACEQQSVVMVHGGYLCEKCETRFVNRSWGLMAVSDFISCHSLADSARETQELLRRLHGRAAAKVTDN